MQVEEQKVNGSVHYDVMLTERRVEDLQVLQKYSRKDEIPFQAVETASEALAAAYEAFVHPLVAPMVTPGCREGRAGSSSPARAALGGVGSQPLPWPLKGMADWVKANRAPRDNDGAMAATGAVLGRHHLCDSGPLSRPPRRVGRDRVLPDLRHGEPWRARRGERSPDDLIDARGAEPVKDALARIEEGGRTDAMVRAALLLMKVGTGRRRLSAMKRARSSSARMPASLTFRPTPPAGSSASNPTSSISNRSGRCPLFRSS